MTSSCVLPQSTTYLRWSFLPLEPIPVLFASCGLHRRGSLKLTNRRCFCRRGKYFPLLELLSTAGIGALALTWKDIGQGPYCEPALIRTRPLCGWLRVCCHLYQSRLSRTCLIKGLPCRLLQVVSDLQ